MKEIMKRAWEIYRTLEGDRIAKLSYALKKAWAEHKSSESELLEIAEWFTDKKAAENGLRVYGGDVVAVIGETEKAYKVIFGSMQKPMTFWAPKSLCKWVKSEKRTITGTYEDGMKAYRELKALYA